MTKAHIFSAMNRSFKLLSLLATVATTYFVAAIFVRVLGGDAPSILGFTVDQKNALFVLAGCTILHIGLLRYIVHYSRLAWIELKEGDRTELYFELTGSNHLLTQGAERLRDSIYNKDGFLFVRVDRHDPPSLLHGIMFLAAVAASIRYEISFTFVWSSIGGLILAMANWQIGSSWLVSLADLGRQSNESLYFDDPERQGPRYFGIVSGPWHGMNNNIFLFAIISLIDALLRVFPASLVVFLLWAFLETLHWLL